jgi:hypothetical protein
LSLLILLLTVYPEYGADSPCGVSMSPQEAYRRAAAVFSGTVEEVKTLYGPRNDPYLQVRIKVESSWKLIDRQEVTIRTNSLYKGACDYFEPGLKYLVYADQLHDTLYVPAGSRTARIDFVQDDLAALGPERLALRPGEFRLYANFLYGLIVCASLALLLSFFVYRLVKSPLRVK